MVPIDFSTPMMIASLNLIIGLILGFNLFMCCYICYSCSKQSNKQRTGSKKIKYNKIISIDDEYDTTSTDPYIDGI